MIKLTEARPGQLADLVAYREELERRGYNNTLEALKRAVIIR